MKNFKLLLVGIMVMALVTGCGMKTNYALDIKEDKSLNLQVTMLMDNELIDTMLGMNFDVEDETEEETEEEKTYTDEERWEYLQSAFVSDENVTYEQYEEGDFKGYIITVSGGNIDDFTNSKASEKYNLASSTDSEEEENPILFIKKGNDYVSNITFDSEDSESMSGMDSYSSSMDVFEMSMTVKLPVKATSNNADEVSEDGKTLTWNLNESKDINFRFNFDGKSSNNIIYICCGCAVVAVVAIATCVVVVKNKKKKAN